MITTKRIALEIDSLDVLFDDDDFMSCRHQRCKGYPSSIGHGVPRLLGEAVEGHYEIKGPIGGAAPGIDQAGR
jgi:hypothetical protein